MLLGGNNNTAARRYSEGFDGKYSHDIDYSASLIEAYLYEEAWTLLENMKPESIPLLFNKAICLYDSHLVEEVLVLLERARSMLEPMQGGLKPHDTPELKAIQEMQRSQLSYLSPMTLRYVDLFPHMVHERLLRVMVDCYGDLNNKAKVVEIHSLLKAKNYHNVNMALEKIEQQEKYGPLEVYQRKGRVPDSKKE